MSKLSESPEDKMWRQIKHHLRVAVFDASVSWRAIYGAKQELGYALNEHERQVLDGAEPLGARAVEKPLKEGWWQKYDMD